MMELMTTEMERGDKDEEGAEKRREEKTVASQRDAKTVASQRSVKTVASQRRLEPPVREALRL